jgi:regulator of RNase E activity RraA
MEPTDYGAHHRGMEETLARLKRLDACAVSDALDQLGLPASISGLQPLAARTRISGSVVTVKLVAGPPPTGAPARHLGTQAIQAAAPGQIVVVEQRTGLDAAGWGGILSTAAKARGVAGAIVEGPVRDIDEAEKLGFPVYARSATARTARGRIHETSTGTPIRVGEIGVATGDFVIADSSGIAFIPADRIEAVLAAAERIAAKEAVMTTAVMAGTAVTAVMGADYECLLQQYNEKS